MTGQSLRKHRRKPEWWDTGLPWRAVRWQLPVVSMEEHTVAGIVVHEKGQYGWNRGDWVNGGSRERSFHYGLDVIGWISDSGVSLPLTKQILCCSPLEGVVTFVGPDEHDHLAVVLRHSAARDGRRRFSFFGDLEEVHIKKGQRVRAGSRLGRPSKLREDYRFFHFGIGYETEGKELWNKIYINPGFSIGGKIQIRRKIPWAGAVIPAS
jgi:hypothetical protein